MSWSKIDQHADPAVETQLGEYWCGAACATMLLRDRGIDIAQPMIAAGLRQPSSGRGLAARLNECSRGRHVWQGGLLALDPPMPRGLVVGLGENGSWAAQLILEGQRHGHWVVVDGLVEEHIEVRDPVGLRYRLPWDEFVVLVRNMVVVFEGGK